MSGMIQSYLHSTWAAPAPEYIAWAGWRCKGSLRPKESGTRGRRPASLLTLQRSLRIAGDCWEFESVPRKQRSEPLLSPVSQSFISHRGKYRALDPVQTSQTQNPKHMIQARAELRAKVVLNRNAETPSVSAWKL